jgi:hypothetical protein
MGMLSNVINKLGASTGFAMYWPNSNQIFVTKVDLHTVVSKLLKDSRSQMQTTLNMTFTFKSLRKKDSQSWPLHIVRISFVL